MPGFRYYIEKDGRPVSIEDMAEWNQWYRTANRLVEKTKVGPVSVVTLFLGMDNRTGSIGPPLLYETVIRGGVLDGTQYLYSTREEDLQGHRTYVDKAKSVRFQSWFRRVLKKLGLGN